MIRKVGRRDNAGEAILMTIAAKYENGVSSSLQEVTIKEGTVVEVSASKKPARPGTPIYQGPSLLWHVGGSRRHQTALAM